jgi:hypothetical protein
MAKKKKDDRVKLDITFEQAIDKALNTPLPLLSKNSKQLIKSEHLTLEQARSLRDRIWRSWSNKTFRKNKEKEERRITAIWVIPENPGLEHAINSFRNATPFIENDAALGQLPLKPYDTFKICITYDIYKDDEIIAAKIIKSLEEFELDEGGDVPDIIEQ